MQRWEYFVAWYYKDDSAAAIEHLANVRGGQGWELVSACLRPGHPDIMLAFFKRPIQDEQKGA